MQGNAAIQDARIVSRKFKNIMLYATTKPKSQNNLKQLLWGVLLLVRETKPPHHGGHLISSHFKAT